MVNTVGKKLQQTRLQKGLTLDDAARATKMRPERIADLERDNYTNFPNLTYAKGFLVLYGKFLQVDVSEFAESFSTENPVGGNDYEYLANIPTTRPAIVRREPENTHRGSFLVLAGFAVLLVAGVLLWYFILSFQRLGDLNRISENRDQPAAATSAGTPGIPDATAAPLVRRAEPAAPSGDGMPHPPLTSVATQVQAPAQRTQAAPAPAPALADNGSAPVEVRRAEAVESAAPPQSPPQAAPSVQPAPPPASNVELTLQPVQTTWVTVKSGDSNSAPVYEDYLYRDARALTFKGNRFWVEVRDKGAVQILKNGEVVPYSSPGVAIE